MAQPNTAQPGGALGRSSSPTPSVLAVGYVLGSIPGIAVVVAAFSVFQRIYRFVPVADVLLVAGFGVVLSAILVYGARANRESDDPTFIAFALGAGVGLAYYTMGGWELSTASGVFAGASVMAAVAVLRHSVASGRKKVGWGVGTAIAALGLGLAPSVLIVLGMWNAIIYQPDLIRGVGFASVLAVVTSATFLGLAAGVRPRPFHGVVRAA